MNEDQTQSILRRLSNLEVHIINLIVPIQNICEALKSSTDIKYLIECLKGPIPINDSKLRIILSDFDKAMNKFARDIEEIKSLNISQTFAEIKYIGKRLNEIEKTLSEIKEKGIDKNIDLNFSVDGYKLVKKPVEYDSKELIEDPDESLIALLDTLPSRESRAVIHRIGLLGEDSKTYEKVGKILGVSRERASQIFAKAVRKLRDPKRKSMMDKVTHFDLKKAVFG